MCDSVCVCVPLPLSVQPFSSTMLRFVLSSVLLCLSVSLDCLSLCPQDDASAPWSNAGRHQLLRAGALPVAARHPHPGRLLRLQPHRQGGAPAGRPHPAALRGRRGPQPGGARHELGRRQLQLGPDGRLQRLGVQESGNDNDNNNSNRNHNHIIKSPHFFERLLFLFSHFAHFLLILFAWFLLFHPRLMVYPSGDI